MLLDPWNRIARFAVVGLTMSLLGVAACSTSTITEVEMGQKLTVGLDDRAGLDIESVESRIHQVLASRPGIENVQFGLHEEIGRAPRLSVAVWGRDLDGDRLEADLRARVPELADAVFSSEPLAGTMEESIASRVGRSILHLDVDAGTSEQVRTQILRQLREQGVDGVAQVEVSRDDAGNATIGITIEHGDDDAVDGGDGTLLLELKEDAE